MVGPAVLKLRARAGQGGSGRIDIMSNVKEAATVGFSAPLEIAGGGWQELTVPLEVKGPLGTLRIYLPECEVDFIEVKPSAGRPLRSDF
jgi:hypothetical protein